MVLFGSLKAFVARECTWSLRRASSLCATISAALPLGQRMMGTCPNVAITLIKLRATLSTTASMSDSCAFGSLRSSYTVRVSVKEAGVDLVVFFDVEDGGAAVDAGVEEGSKEKRVGSRTTKSKYWSYTCSTNSTVLFWATSWENSSRRARGRMLVKLT